MSAAEFEILYDAVVAKTAGWDDALITAWPCLVQNQVQVNLLLIAV